MNNICNTTQDFCRAYENEEETIQHFLCECPTLERLRQKHFRIPKYKELAEMANKDLKDLVKFCLEF